MLFANWYVRTGIPTSQFKCLGWRITGVECHSLLRAVIEVHAGKGMHEVSTDGEGSS